jgi:hypothetical protein
MEVYNNVLMDHPLSVTLMINHHQRPIIYE